MADAFGGWGSGFGTTVGGGYGGTYSPMAQRYKGSKGYAKPRPKGGGIRGRWGPSKIFDPFGVPWGGPPRSPMAGAVAKAIAKMLGKPKWRRPMTSFGERGVHKVSTEAFEKALAGYLVTQATPQFDWWSPFGIDFGPQAPTTFDPVVDPFQWMMTQAIGRKRWFNKKKRRKNRRRR